MKNVLLVFGGKSYEHDISVVTASQIYQKVKSEEIKLIPLYVSRENKMFIYEAKEFDIRDFSKTKFTPKNKRLKEVVFVSGEKNKLFIRTLLGLKEYLESDVAIFACHGNIGENGRLVAMFEEMNICCSAGNVDGLAVCMNKFLFKQVMKGLKVPVVKGFKLTKTELASEEKRQMVEIKLRLLEFPVVIKVNNGGSSIGVFTANNIEEFNANVKQAFEFDEIVIVERLIKNAREFNVAVLGLAEDHIVSEIDEPLKNEEVLSFADKYLNGGKKGSSVKGKIGSMESQNKRFPADISEELKNKIKAYASKIFRELNLCGVVRIDFLYSEELNKIYVCEANAIPGSLSYYFFEKGKVLLNDYVETLIKVAEKNFEQNNNFNQEFVTDVLG